MADQVKPKPQAFRYVDPDTGEGLWIYDEIAAQVREIHKGLEGARIIALFKDNWSEDAEGNTKLGDLVPVTEGMWRVFAALVSDQEPPDYLMLLNGTLWPLLKEAQQKYVVDELLCRGCPRLDKNGDQAEDTSGRQLWTTKKPDFSGFAGPIARHGAQMERIKAFMNTATNGGQLKLDAPTTSARRPTRQRRPPGQPAPELSRDPQPPELHYYERRNFEELGPAMVSYGGADRRTDQVDGVHYFADATEAEGVAAESLDYDRRPAVLKEVRQHLERERATWGGQDAATILDEAALTAATH